jgi:uncharacterized membrane protein
VSRPLILLLLAAVVWLAAVVVAPLVASSMMAGGIYAAAGTVCHQLPDRTLHLAGAPVAVCARCLGLYAGGVLGVGAALLAGRMAATETADSARRARLLVAALAVPTMITLALEHVARLPVGNVARVVTAVPLGGAIAWVIARAIAADAARSAMTEVD